MPDYKWYCFYGEPKFCQVIQDRSSNETIDFFDTEWKHQEFVGFNPKAGNAVVEPQKTVNLRQQVDIARRLAAGKPYSRIDLYTIGDKLYFGEITLYPMSGMGHIKPEKYDDVLGQMLILPGQSGGLIQLQNDLSDYKLFCFIGDVKLLYVATERQKRGEPTKFDFFDENFIHLPVQQKGHPNAAIIPSKPEHFEKMKQLAEKLSKGIPHVRVDFYESGDTVLFGEMTFYSMSGMFPFEPSGWDYKFGEYLKLPYR